MGLESPASLELQQRRGASSVASSGPKAYTILTPQDATVQQGQLFGVKHTYRIPSSALPGQQQPGSGVASGVQTPAGIATPRIASGHASPFVHAPGIGTPFIGVPGPTASGTNTPLMAGQGGSATPLGVTVSLNPNEMGKKSAGLQLEWQLKSFASKDTHRQHASMAHLSRPGRSTSTSRYVTILCNLLFRARRCFHCRRHSPAAPSARGGCCSREGSCRADRSCRP